MVDAARVPVLDPDELRDGRDWPAALAAWRTALGAALDAGGAVAVTTALREGHRLGLAKTAAAAGAPAHLVLLDADAGTCRAGRAAQGAPRISDGLFEHLLAEWAAYRRRAAGSRRSGAVRVDHRARPAGRRSRAPDRDLTLWSRVREEPERGLEPLRSRLQGECSTN